MQCFALFTVAIFVWLALFTAMLPREMLYPTDEDEWWPERYEDVADASYEVGYHVPSLHGPPGWRLQGVFVAWRGDTGLVDVTYVSDTSATLTLSINRRRALAPYIKAKDDGDEARTLERVRFAGRFTQLETYSTSTVAVMTTHWVRNGMPITATAFVYATKDGALLSKQQFLEALETVH
jgi:hypothetical protein